MFITDEPYVSEYLIKTINKNRYDTLMTPIVSKKIKNLSTTYIKQKKVYTNSENALEKIQDDELHEKISLFKNKFKTRELLKEFYPDFFYMKVPFEKLSSVDSDILPYPVILKPAVGFLSIGVYVIENSKQYYIVTEKLKNDIKNALKLFPKSVLGFDDFIIEKAIQGEEIAVDMYYNSDGEPVILNVYKHPFVSKEDTSDRLYYTSSKIVFDYSKILLPFFENLAKSAKLTDFPLHAEFRIENNIPQLIEINPLRFAGWCLCDIAQYAHKINVYEAYMKNFKPVFNQNDNTLYAFVLAEVPTNIKKDDIISFDANKFKKDLKIKVLEQRIFNFREKPLFGTFFAKAEREDEFIPILKLNTANYIKTV